MSTTATPLLQGQDLPTTTTSRPPPPSPEHHYAEELLHAAEAAAETAGRVAGPGRLLGLAYIVASPFLLAAGVLSIMVFDSPIRSTMDEVLRWLFVFLAMILLPLATAAAGCLLTFSNRIATTVPSHVPVALWPVVVVVAILVLFAVYSVVVPKPLYHVLMFTHRAVS